MTSGVPGAEELPAWSDAFTPDRLGPAPRLGLPVGLRCEWAFGDGSGAGVRVAVIDSGIDAAIPRSAASTGT